MSKQPIAHEIDNQKKRGVLLILTGPTGAGKDTVLSYLQKDNPQIVKITTTTSRQKRTNEIEGNPYYFISRAQFEQLIAEGAFFEWVEFRGALYGTQKKTLMEALEKGVDVVWRIDTRGVKNIKEKVKNHVKRSVFVFLTAGSVAMLRKRVEKDEGVTHSNRWNEPLVLWEMEQYDDCDYLVVNDDNNLEKTGHYIKAIMQAKRLEILK